MKFLLAALVSYLLCGTHPGVAAESTAAPDTLRFAPLPRGAEREDESSHAGHFGHPERWLRAPFGDQLLTDPEQWRSEGRRAHRGELELDYNRVDPVRLGLAWEAQFPGTVCPRLGARYAYATARDRALYGFQLEQPLERTGRYAVGFSVVRVTGHLDLQQVEDFENSLALLFARTDYRDYFEREGFGGYLAWRVPDFSNVSVHLRSDDYRSLPLYTGTQSWFNRDRELRANPPVDAGTARTATVRLERLARHTHLMHAGFYHWVEIEWAGGSLGGDFEYTRALADLRGVVRVSPASTLSLRAVAGHNAAGDLPAQKEFTAGGADGLRAHPISGYRGDQVLLGQAEYIIGLWRLRSRGFEGGLHAIAFVDAGRAWRNPEHTWDVGRQAFAVDGGIGLGTSEDNLRVYLAKNLQEPGSDWVVSVRLQRPF